VRGCLRHLKAELDEAAPNDELFLRRRTSSTSSSAVPKEITTDGVEFGRSYSKGDRLVEVRPRGGMLVWSVGLKRNCCPPDPCEQMDFKKSYLNIF